MQRTRLCWNRVLALVCLGILASGTVLADKPAWAGGGKEDKHGQDDQRRENYRQEDKHGKDDRRPENYSQEARRGQDDRREQNDGRDNDRDRYRHDNGPRQGGYFDERRRASVHDYYAAQIRAGRCPPGLSRKHNGCVPPGHAKRWKIGRALPREVIFYDLSPEILLHLGPPPPRHRYVRVSNDILLIAIGSGMVIDAIQSLGGG